MFLLSTIKKLLARILIDQVQDTMQYVMFKPYGNHAMKDISNKDIKWLTKY